LKPACFLATQRRGPLSTPKSTYKVDNNIKDI
jgi:hypothetical protein